MDLDEFEQVEDGGKGDFELQREEKSYFSKALKVIDAKWYANFSKKSRWMDLVGDYAGQELFCIDGDSLLQHVLDDPLLALAKNDISFQSLHAKQSLETLLVGLQSRHANFEIVFWNDHRHTATRCGSSAPIVTSRLLARRILFNHLLQLNVKVHVFSALTDIDWAEHRARFRPMFILTNDGGTYDENVSEDDAKRLLLQRLIVKDILGSGMAVAHLSSLEFRDSKIFTFVMEEMRQSSHVVNLPDGVRDAQNRAKKEFTAFAANIVPAPQALQKTSNEKEGHTLETVLTRSIGTVAKNPDVAHDSTIAFLMKAFVAHLLCVEILPLQLRAQHRPLVGEDLKETILNRFYPTMFAAVDEAISSSSISLDVDGYLFSTIVDIQLRHPDVPFSRIVGDVIDDKLKKIFCDAGIRDLSGHPGSDLTALTTNGQVLPVTEAPVTISVLPFTHPAVEGLLPKVKEEAVTNVDPSRSFFAYQHRFDDTRHWHGKRTILPSHQGGEAASKLSSWDIMKQQRKHQRNIANMQKLAASLTGALGSQLQRKRILASARSSHAQPASRSEERSSYQPKAKKGKQPPMKKADMIKLQNKTDKEKKGDDELLKKWSAEVKRMQHPDRNLNLRRNMEEVEAILGSCRTQDNWYDAEVRLYQIHTELRLWASSSDKEGLRDAFSVSILRKVIDLSKHKHVTNAIIDCLESVLNSMGFLTFAPSLLTQARSIGDRRLSFNFVKLQRRSGEQLYPFMRINEDPVEWQLRLFGEYMDRSMDGKEDNRVDFKPDGWQRKVLDSLDANESVLVVAPTSAGKTFISFYAMEKVLRDSDDGILVYIAPTKALVNQVAAEVYARFEKDVPNGSMWSIHTRDYRLNDPQKCQILVTVPEMFAIMLLSPPLAKLWTPRIKRIILDEIHSIGQQEGGAVWEQILLLAPCPIIGLSATIGSPEVFNEWLASVQKAHNFKHTFVCHPYRYSHLRKHIYRLSDTRLPFKGLSSSDRGDNIRFLHPVSALAFGTSTIPSDFSLEARDTLSLYNALRPFASSIPGELRGLAPREFFVSRGEALLRQKDVIHYEASLKDVLLTLMSSPDDRHRSILRDTINRLEDAEIAKVGNLDTAPSRQDFLQGLIHLLYEMNFKKALPAILFAFDRNNIEVMAKKILGDLKRAEDVEKKSPSWMAKVKQWETWKLLQEKRQKANAKSTKKRGSDMDDTQDTQEASSSWESRFDPSDPLPEFSFSDFKRYSHGELMKDIEDLTRSKAAIPGWVFDGLRRGIAVHHSGMNKGYRSLVERLFRQGYVRVMFATGTLALGINAPAKSSVFCGDSPFLTALNYRQCAGRAGRRGYDLLGNVIFYGIPMDRIQRLILSKLPLLTGNFPLTSTLSLRLFNLLHGSQNSATAVNAVQSLMSLPQISFGSSSGKQQLAHHMRFSIEYLRRAGLLDDHGKPMDLYGIAAHLYFTEPSNFALIALLRNGVLHRVAEQTDSEQAKRDLMLILCHLFGRRYLPQAYGALENITRLRVEKKYSSLIVLPPLPDYARVELERHNAEILKIFSAYASSYVSATGSSLGTDNMLPLSKHIIGGSSEENKTELEGSVLIEHLKQSAIQVSTRSLFVANSGLADEVHSVEELARTCRRGLELNEHAIPSLTHISSPPSESHPKINAYLYDFFTHGQLEMLVTANGIRRGEVWYLLQDFDMTLKAIRLALDQLLLEASGKKVGDGLEGMDGELAALENDWEDDDDVAETSEVTKPMSIDEVEEEVRSEVASSNWEDDDLTATERLHRPKSGSSTQTPIGITNADRRVVDLVRSVCEEFSVKFRKIFA